MRSRHLQSNELADPVSSLCQRRFDQCAWRCVVESWEAKTKLGYLLDRTTLSGSRILQGSGRVRWPCQLANPAGSKALAHNIRVCRQGCRSRNGVVNFVSVLCVRFDV